MRLRPTDRRRSASATSGCVLRVMARVAGCRLRGGHEWDVVAVSTPLPQLRLPAQYRLVCRACGESGGPTSVVGRADPARATPGTAMPVDTAVRPPAVVRHAARSSGDARLVPAA